MKTNQRGMTLVEIILVIAVIGIMAGASVSMIGQVHYANTKKAAEAVGTALDKQQLLTMSKEGKPYLYIYKRSDGYYIKQLDECLTAFDAAKLDADGTKLSGNGTEIYLESETGTLLEGNGFIRIRYKKSGVFDKDTASDGTAYTNVEKIVVKGTGTYTITLVEETGKHPVE